MRDVELWQRLHAGDRSREIVGGLQALAERSATERAPFLRMIETLVREGDAEVRAAAIAVLAGTRGVPGLQCLVAALDDDDEGVRAAAVAALAETARVAPHRYAHALFHGRVDVRRRAIERAPAETASMIAWLRADPEVREAARRVPWSAVPLDLVDDLWRRGAIEPAEAVGAIAPHGVEDLRAWIRRTDRRLEPEVVAWIAAATKHPPLPPVVGTDALDRFVEILLRAGDEAHACWGPLFDAVIVPDEPVLRGRTVVALVHAAARIGWSPAAMRLAVACDPRVLCFGGLDASVRRTGIEVVWSQRDRMPSLPGDLIDALLASELPRSATGAADLRIAAGLAALAAERRVRAIVDALGEDVALARSLDDDRGWDAVCRIPPETAHLWWLSRLAAIDERGHRRACAIAAIRWVRAAPERLAADGGPLAEDLAGVTAAMLELGTEGWEALDIEAIAAFVPIVLERLDDPARARVLAAALACAPEHDLARALLVALAGASTTDAFVAAVAAAGPTAAGRLLAWTRATLTLGEELSVRLAEGWLDHPDVEVRGFAARMLRAQRSVPSTARPPVVAVHNLSAGDRDRIATCTDDELEAALAVPLALPCRGLTDALARRPPPGRPHLSACVALLACIDGLEPVAAQLGRFGADDDAFVDDLRIAATTMWRGSQMLPPLADAFLVAWDEHVDAFSTWLEAEDGGWGGALRAVLPLSCGFVRRRLWEATATVLVAWSWQRLGRRIAAGLDPEIPTLLVDHLDTDLGPAAARMIVALQRVAIATDALARLRARVLAIAPSCDRRTHFELRPWIGLGGVPARDAPTRKVPLALPHDERAEIGATADLDALTRVCREGREPAVHEAALRLVEIGEAGELCLVELLGAANGPPFVDAIFESIGLWSSAAGIGRIRALVDDESLPAARRYRLAFALVERGEPTLVDRTIALASEAASAGVVQQRHWDRLVELAPDTEALVHAAAVCRDATFAAAALEWLFARPTSDVAVVPVLRRFLLAGSDESVALRRRAAQCLLAHGDRFGLPILLAKALDPEVKTDETRSQLAAVLAKADAELVDTFVAAALLGGKPFADEATVVELLRPVRWELRDHAHARLLLDGVDPDARKLLVAERVPSIGRSSKLAEVAAAFAWGMLRGRELTGDLYGIHMTSKREDWGHTRMTSRALHVTPLPILRGDRHGRDIVEGLVLHEIGHHVWHRGKAAGRVWKRASKEGLFPLLNLVADEHLERNLRSIAAEFGDRIKRLDAYAFQHAAREIGVERLLGMLLGGAVEVLPRLAMAVAYTEDCVRIDSGRILAELDRRGHSFARFVRALRMGLGNRSGDPRVDAALALFRDGFRRLDMAGLYQVTKVLADMFGSDALLANGFGGHESIEWDERDAAVHGEGISDADVQREVERILDPPRGGVHGGGGGPRRLQINVGGDAKYEKLTTIQPVTPNPAQHKADAAAVSRHALRLRDTLMRLGLAHVPARGRLRGHAFDRTKARAVVLRGDPHMLVARETAVKADLFLGVIIDCSGSMTGDNIARAKRFGVLVAEAARGLPGVDARFFGFTDRIVYEAGDAQRCGVTSLVAGGGNNDAGALDHVANLAAKSRRRSKLLVMVSDGLPTECSVMALRNVVQQLGRRHGMCCAQVAVRALEEVCFPHYVVLDDANLDLSVRRFGDLVGKLVGRAISG